MPGPLQSNDIAALVLKQVETAQALSACAISHAAIVNAYRTAQAQAQAWNSRQ